MGAVARKLRFALLLPAVQASITTVLVLWADRVHWMLMGANHRAPGPYVHVHLMAIKLRYIWSGVNAPTFPYCLLTGDWPPVLHLAIGEVLYLIAVTLLWYWIGSYFDHRKGSAVPATPRAGTVRKTILRFLLVGWGMFLLFGNLWTIGDAFPELFLGGRSFRPEVVIVRTLFLLWSAILVVFPGLGLVQDLRRKRSTYLSLPDTAARSR
jgi:hypothetical protein